VRSRQNIQWTFAIGLSVLFALVGVLCLFAAYNYAAAAEQAQIERIGTGVMPTPVEQMAYRLARETNSGAANGFAVAGGLCILASAVVSLVVLRSAEQRVCDQQAERLRKLEGQLASQQFGLEDQNKA
jgi:hypothetical protein